MTRLQSLLAACCLASICLTASPGLAGQHHTLASRCAVDGNGVTYCQGTLRGFRESAGDTNYAMFQVTQRGAVSFRASYNSSNYYCTFDTNTGSAFAASAAGTIDQFFLVYITNGRCTGSYLENSSALIP